MLNASATRNFIDKLVGDHVDIEQLASSLWLHARYGECVDALDELVALHVLITRHDGLEENVLFPALARRVPSLGERVRWLRRQHRAAEEALLAVEGALLDGEDALAARHAAELHALLVGNHTTEEQALYVCIDEMLARYAEVD